jgi:hypothetical protein
MRTLSVSKHQVAHGLQADIMVEADEFEAELKESRLQLEVQ